MNFFSKRRARHVASIIHELCHAGRHANMVFGPDGAVGFFSKHPFLKNHRTPGLQDDPHGFCLARELSPFEFLVYDTEDLIQVIGSGDYAGTLVTTTKSGGYLVSLSQPLTQPIGRDSRAFVNVFVRDFGALDTS